MTAEQKNAIRFVFDWTEIYFVQIHVCVEHVASSTQPSAHKKRGKQRSNESILHNLKFSFHQELAGAADDDGDGDNDIDIDSDALI